MEIKDKLNKSERLKNLGAKKNIDSRIKETKPNLDVEICMKNERSLKWYETRMKLRAAKPSRPQQPHCIILEGEDCQKSRRVISSNYYAAPRI